MTICYVILKMFKYYIFLVQIAQVFELETLILTFVPFKGENFSYIMLKTNFPSIF